MERVEGAGPPRGPQGAEHPDGPELGEVGDERPAVEAEDRDVDLGVRPQPPQEVEQHHRSTRAGRLVGDEHDAGAVSHGATGRGPARGPAPPPRRRIPPGPWPMPGPPPPPGWRGPGAGPPPG